jgi:drug/metabolite transporter (DMT)-like permease
MRIFEALLLAIATAVLYALSSALQALEARRAPAASALRLSLITRLVRRPMWLLGTAAGFLAWPMQAGALALASVALVQPALGIGLIVLLVLGVRVLGERVQAREVVAAAGIAAAVGVLAWAAPHGNGRFAHAATVAIVAGAALVSATPLVLRLLHATTGLATSLAAGVGWGVVGFATALLDEALARRHWLDAFGWLVAVGIVGWSSLLCEMTSLQAWPATRAIPVTFAVEMALPAALEPVFTTSFPPHPVAYALALAAAAAAAVALGRSETVGQAVAPA